MLDQILSFMNSHLESSIAIVAVVMDFILRLFKTSKPLDILRLGAVFIRKGIDYLKIGLDLISKVSLILEKAASYLDRVLPQNVKPE